MNTGYGQCDRCGETNPRTGLLCKGCLSRLPWAPAHPAPKPKRKPEHSDSERAAEAAGAMHPLLGAALYFYWKDKDPAKADLARKGAMYNVKFIIFALVIFFVAFLLRFLISVVPYALK